MTFTKFDRLRRNYVIYIFYGVITALPFGVGVQNLMIFLALFVLTFTSLKRTTPALINNIDVFVPVILSGATILWMITATFLNAANQYNPMEELFGYLFWILGPIVFYLNVARIGNIPWSTVGKIAGVILVVWGGVCFTQYLYGWKIVGTSVFLGDGTRARGFYSHPLSLAYTSVILWPVLLHWWWQNKFDCFAFLAVLGCGLLILFSQSRMVQVVSGAIFFISVCRYTRGYLRIGVILTLLLAAGSLWFTQNMVSEKFKKTISSSGLDRFSEYPDDRFVFWRAHLLMFKERPIIGHGFGVDADYRENYYTRIGMENFQKNYPAHNTFLQIAVNGGLISLGFFIGWLIWVFNLALRIPVGSWVRGATYDTFLAFFISSLTQNSFQDSCVRMALVILVVCLWIANISYSENRLAPLK